MIACVVFCLELKFRNEQIQGNRAMHPAMNRKPYIVSVVFQGLTEAVSVLGFKMCIPIVKKRWDFP